MTPRPKNKFSDLTQVARAWGFICCTFQEPISMPKLPPLNLSTQECLFRRA